MLAGTATGAPLAVDSNPCPEFDGEGLFRAAFEAGKTAAALRQAATVVGLGPTKFQDLPVVGVAEDFAGTGGDAFQTERARPAARREHRHSSFSRSQNPFGADIHAGPTADTGALVYGMGFLFLPGDAHLGTGFGAQGAAVADFGIDAVRLHLLSRWNAIPLLAGAWIPARILAGYIEEATTAGFNWWSVDMDMINALVLFFTSIGLVALGYLLISDAPQEEQLAFG